MMKLAFLLLLAAVPLRADLASQVRGVSGWAGYSVPIADGRHVLCSWESTTIESHRETASGSLLVLYEVADGSVRSVRVSSPECRATKQIHWIQGVDPRESVRFLRALVDDDDVSRKALTALALHRGVEDDLIRVARDHASASVRGHALFWVSQHAGEKAAAALRQAVDNDPETRVKEKAVFGISQLPDERSIPMLIDLMKTHRNAAVRKKAAFWLGQKNDPRALAAFEDILR
ncbi:MAG: HEAT repeat domain-containing protein [Thermoanaerobaculia bacterium]|nr:HEAT repeat domain-containing protein [Thermoanaerobaculia bacterium]